MCERTVRVRPIFVWILLGRLFLGFGRVFDRALHLLFEVVRRAILLPLGFRMELIVLDVIYVLGVVALFVVVGLLGKAVEKL